MEGLVQLFSMVLQWLASSGYLSFWSFVYLFAIVFFFFWGLEQRRNEPGGWGEILMVLSGIMIVGYLFLFPLLQG
jgi:hypothetical protein